MLKSADLETARACKETSPNSFPSHKLSLADPGVFPSSAKANDLSCLKFFEEPVNKWPDAEAIWSRERTYTWKETHTKACQYAGYFLELGLRPGELVAFCLRNSPEFIFAWLGLWAIVGSKAFNNGTV